MTTNQPKSPQANPQLQPGRPQSTLQPQPGIEQSTPLLRAPSEWTFTVMEEDTGDTEVGYKKDSPSEEAVLDGFVKSPST